MDKFKFCVNRSIVVLGLLVMAPRIFLGDALKFPETRGFFDSLNVSLVTTWPFSWSVNVATDSVRKLAFVGCGGGVFIMDLSDSTNPYVISDGIRSRDRISSCYYSYIEQRLYVASGYDGFQAWDVVDPYNPQKILSYDTRGRAMDVYVKENYAYVACYDSGLSIIDISDPNSPYEIGHLAARTSTNAVRVIDDYAYVGESFGGVFRVYL